MQWPLAPTTSSARTPKRTATRSSTAPGAISPAQPEVPEAKIRGSHEGFQWVRTLGSERVPGVLKRVQRGPMGPPGPLELSALVPALAVGGADDRAQPEAVAVWNSKQRGATDRGFRGLT